QIEGSGRVILEDGTPLRISYDSHNGYSYSSIERALIERNLISRKEMSPQRVRDWMAAHPDEAAKVRAANRSYAFFRVTALSNEGEPVGAQGVPLTPGRSIAVDQLHAYGTPFFIQANLPIENVKSVSPFGRLVIAQDTGSAIVGPARADLYWGAGDDAGRIANRIRHPGRFVMLLPREIDMAEAGRHMPLPPPKPKALAEVSKHDKGKVDSAAAEDRQRQFGARKLPARDCATGSGIDCGRKSAPSVVITSKRLATTSRGPAGDKPQQQQHQQQGQKQLLAHQAQPGMQSGGPDQQQGKSRGPQLKQQPKATEGRGPQQKQQPPTTEGRGAQQKEHLQATAGREPQQRKQQAAIERRGPQQKPQPTATESRQDSMPSQPKQQPRGQQQQQPQQTQGQAPT